MSDGSAKVERIERIHDGFLKLDRVLVTHTRYDGTSQTVVRECFDRGEAAAALLVDPARRTVWLTEQFRYPTLSGGSGWMLEVPAGLCDGTEDSADAARREVAEELGFIVDTLVPVGAFYVSPGSMTERVWLYAALVDGAARDGALAEASMDPDEDIRAVEMDVDAFIEAGRAGQILDAKTLIASLWLASNGARLGI